MEILPKIYLLQVFYMLFRSSLTFESTEKLFDQCRFGKMSSFKHHIILIDSISWCITAKNDW